MLREIHGAGLSLRTLALVGFGEPLFNSRIPDMAALARRLYPDANIFLDTNANFGKKRAEEIADCGLNVIRLALDGVDQQSYAPYRRNGDFDRALQFTRDLAKAIRETGSKTRAVWKYILFKHNDTDADILKAVALSKEIGISIIFDATVGAWASPRTSDELHALVGQHFGCNIDPTSTDGAQMELGQPKEGTALSRLFRRLRGGSDAKSPAQ